MHFIPKPRRAFPSRGRVSRSLRIACGRDGIPSDGTMPPSIRTRVRESSGDETGQIPLVWPGVPPDVGDGPVLLAHVSRPVLVLGGLHHVYARAA